MTCLSRPPGDLVLDGSSTLTLPASSLQQLTRLFEQYLLSRSQQHGFLALPSHPADTASLLQLQFLFDVLQKTISLKVSRGPKNLIRWFPYDLFLLFKKPLISMSYLYLYPAEVLIHDMLLCVLIFLTQLINPTGVRLHSVVKIFPFKSLKCLEV